MFDTQQALQSIEKEIQNIALGTHPTELYEPIRYIMDLGGKRIRPILVLIGNYLFTDDWQKNTKPALAVEIFHNFTLLHDDIMDNAPIRRGKPTVHEKWNSNIALLSGDVMLVKAYQQLDFVEEKYFHTILRKFHQCAIEVCEGQQLDMNFEKVEKISQGEYINMIRLKTAVLLGFSLEFGAVIGGADPENAQQLYDFGVNIGIGFQLKDDLLDVYSDQAKFGKQVGGDIIANKKTFLLIKALEKATGETQDQLQSWLTKVDFDKEEKVKAIIEIYNSLNIKQETESKMNEYFYKAFQSLDSIPIKKEKKEALISFTNDLINREK
ncbi:polyprenyl synthetase family protein [Thermoflexibacter ruber]|uniref:Geranylgeranyl diphosphate synthase, type II n=1 Tax=Thermoflexibacter ruber TaxID=1003 RepID=A0A1I2H9T0_9BACT|nr:polyprenyl synthetase family protein [Thermoflexibacter ruber]SFF25496.1 geranylgeranyl diphosphate synthase, type II [Thermoflexibacter ruber]